MRTRSLYLHMEAATSHVAQLTLSKWTFFDFDGYKTHLIVEEYNNHVYIEMCPPKSSNKRQFVRLIMNLIWF